MIFHDSVQTYTRPTVNIGIRQNLARRNAWELPGGVLLWKAAGKVALIVFAVTLALNVVLSAYKGHLGTVAAVVDGQRHELVDRNINLRAVRAGMLTEQAVAAAAGKALSLYKPEPGQHLVYNRSKGQFDNL